MPRPRTDAGIEEEVYRKAINYPRLGATLIHREIIGDGNLPAVRTIGEMIARARALSPAEQLRYREVRWPESFGGADLPWESAAAVIELTRSIDGRAPLVRLAIWYWRASLAMPGPDFLKQRLRLAAHAALGDSQPNRTEVFASIHDRIVSGDIPSGVHGDEPAATNLLMDVAADELLRRAAKGVAR
jgi:alkylation response protein AidB-like acyl-CoA dehydrogenase